MTARQLPLPLVWQRNTGSVDFYLGEGNREAADWLTRGPSLWNHHATLLWGPAKSGKSHLAAMFASRFGARMVDPRAPGALHQAMALAHVPLVLDGLGAGVDEAALFHLYNAAHLNGGTLLLVANALPRLWPVQLPDLASRLDACPKITIAAPDDDMLARVLSKQMADHGWTLAPDVVAYLLARMERSFAGVFVLSEALHAEAQQERRDLTVPLAANVLKNLKQRDSL